jgi:hypothetical protein
MDRIENESDWIENETNEEWTEGELREFKRIEQKLINESLSWNKEAVSKIRAVYSGDSITTKWIQKQKNIKLEEHVKKIKKIDTFFNRSLKVLENQIKHYHHYVRLCKIHLHYLHYHHYLHYLLILQ